MIKNILLVILTFSGFLSFSQEKTTGGSFSFPKNISPGDYQQGKIIIRVREEYKSFCKSNSIDIPSFSKELESIGATAVRKKFPSERPPLKSLNEKGEKLVDLSLIYEVEIENSIALEKAINRLYQTGVIEYAEPLYIPKTCFTPGDPEINKLYALDIMRVFEAWSINKGDTNVVIGIVDTGIDIFHEDLKDNIKYNYNDPINGFDDDGDGYVDNFYGWDVGENNNDPHERHTGHGVHVAGTAAATTDNGKGIAGVGFRCKFLPVKVTNEHGQLTAAYDGIIYAAKMGCDVINCSWGSSGGGQFGQDVINFATFNHGALVVAAAGNNNSEELFFPAAYKNTLAVAAINNNDERWGGSSFGYYVDICAPGQDIYSTTSHYDSELTQLKISENSYGWSSGTSMAAPNAAGAAALVKSHFPHYNAFQVAEQLKVTADDVYLNHPPDMEGKLGFGRINLFRALMETEHPSVTLSDYRAKGSSNEYVFVGDTILLTGYFTNYLAPASNVTVTLTALDNFVRVHRGSVSLGNLGTMEKTDNGSNPFRIEVLKDAPINAEAAFRITISGANHKPMHHYIKIPVNVDFINLEVNDISTTITSKGRLGYNKPGQKDGIGFKYLDHPTLLYESGLLIGTAPEKVSSTVRGPRQEYFEDFSSVLRAEKSPTKFSHYDIEGKFNDYNSGTPLRVVVNHNTYAWTTEGDRKYIIQLYDIVNTGEHILENFYAGLFADWDIEPYDRNRINYDAENRMSYTFSTEKNGLFAGLKLLSHENPPVHYAIDNIPGGGGGIDITGGFDKEKHFFVLSNEKHEAGISGAGNDVIDVMSSGPFYLPPGDTAYVAFAIIAGKNLEDLQQSALAAQKKYDEEIPRFRNHKAIDNSEVWLGNCYPNPANHSSTLEFFVPEPMEVQFNLFNSTGQVVRSFINGTAPQGLNRIRLNATDLQHGVYYYRLRTKNTSRTGKLIIIK